MIPDRGFCPFPLMFPPFIPRRLAADRGLFYTLSVMICGVGEQGITDEAQKIPYGYPIEGLWVLRVKK